MRQIPVARGIIDMLMETNPTTSVDQINPADSAFVYRLISELLTRELTEETILALAELARDASSPLAKIVAFEPVRASIADLSADPDKAAGDLAGVFAFMFLGVGGRRSAPPYESAYVSAEGRVWQAPAMAMQKELAALDLHILKDFPEPPDHVAIELAVASALAERDDAAVLVAFLEQRLAPWIRDFAAACEGCDRNGFYAALTKAAADFIEMDLNRLSAEQL